MVNSPKKVDNASVVQGFYIRGWRLFAKNWRLLVPILFGAFLINIILVETVFSDTKDLINAQSGPIYESITQSQQIKLISYLGVSFITAILLSSTMISSLIMIIKTKKKVSLGQALNMGLENFWPVATTTALSGLLVAAGLVMFVLPGVIIAFFMIMSVHARIEQKVGVIESLKASYEMVRAHGMQVLMIILVIIGVSFTLGLMLAAIASPLDNLTLNLIDLAISVPLGGLVLSVLTVAYFDYKKSFSAGE